jgi:hypothetical protein
MARQYEPRGWLVKLSTGTLRKQWHRRYFVLSGHELRYYRLEVRVFLYFFDILPFSSYDSKF